MNPTSGAGNGPKILEDVLPIFLNANHKVTVNLTKRKGDARELAASLNLTGIAGIISIGGDGTFSEVLNGLLSDRPDGKEVAIGIIPAGCGNAIAHEMWGTDNAVDIAYQLIKRPLVKKTFPKIRYMDKDREAIYYLCCYFTSGFIPNAIERAEEWRWAGSFRYHIGFSAEMLLSEETNPSAQIVVDSTLVADGPITLFLGGRNFSLDPSTKSPPKPNSMTFVVFDPSVTGLAIFENIGKLLTGEGKIEDGGVKLFEGQVCDIRGGRREGVSVDGEVGIVNSTPIRVEANGATVMVFGTRN
uniref:DAGKc domain-containing protein n=1 Tax=Arcella intermedia TaxID=1963864 RepID=A0A6B2LBJ2_9EUKA